MNPRLILAVILGGMTGVFTLTILNGGFGLPGFPGFHSGGTGDDAKRRLLR